MIKLGAKRKMCIRDSLLGVAAGFDESRIGVGDVAVEVGHGDQRDIVGKLVFGIGDGEIGAHEGSTGF